MKYRIKVKTELSGKSHYYVQQKTFLFIWIYTGQSFSTLEEVKSRIKKEINLDNFIKQQKIVKTETINYEY